MSNGRMLLGVSAEVIIDRDACQIRYRDEAGEVLVTRNIPRLEDGDAITIPFYADVSVDYNVTCRECGDDA